MGSARASPAGVPRRAGGPSRAEGSRVQTEPHACADVRLLSIRERTSTLLQWGPKAPGSSLGDGKVFDALACKVRRPIWAECGRPTVSHGLAQAPRLYAEDVGKVPQGIDLPRVYPHDSGLGRLRRPLDLGHGAQRAKVAVARSGTSRSSTGRTIPCPLRVEEPPTCRHPSAHQGGAAARGPGMSVA